MIIKNKNPFKAYQEAQVKERIEIITDKLKFFHDESTIFKSKTSLAKILAPLIYQEEKFRQKNGDTELRPINKSTLLRKPYNALLTQYMAGHFESPNSIQKFEDSLTSPAQKSLLFTKNLKIKNIESENQRLHQYISSYGLDYKTDGIITSESTDKDRIRALEVELSNTVKAIALIQKNLDLFLQIDWKNKCLINPAEIYNNVIVPEKYLKSFFSYMKSSMAPMIEKEESNDKQ